MKKKLIRAAATAVAVGIIAGSASNVVFAHHGRRATTTVSYASCYQNGVCTGNGSCDQNGVCQNGGVCVDVSCYQEGSCGGNYGSHHSEIGHHSHY